jgi:hypothetical protein
MVFPVLSGAIPDCGVKYVLFKDKDSVSRADATPFYHTNDRRFLLNG